MADRNFSLLLVSPDRTLLRRLTRFLDVFGYEVRQAVQSAQAEAAVEAGRVDFLVVDESLGKQTAQICRAVRRNIADGYTYALLLTQEPQAADLTEALDAGFDDFLARPVVFGELLARLRAGARVLEFERRLTDQCQCDVSTGLPNSAALLAAIGERLTSIGSTSNSASRSKLAKSATLVVVDLDFFRRIARRLGHDAGHKLAATASERLRSVSKGQTWFALGLDRFATLVDQSEKDAAESIHVWLQKALQQEIPWGQDKVVLSASAGASDLLPGQPPQKTLDRAAAALQLAKASGRGSIVTAREMDEDHETWNQLAAGGNLFASTRARDVMIPCAVTLNADDSVEQAQSLFDQTRLSAMAVIDVDGRFAGILTSDMVSERRSRSAPKPRASGPVRLVKHVMLADVPKFDESATLSELMEFFTGDGSALAVVVRDRRPTGLVYCQSLAALNERLTPQHFVPVVPYSQSSEFLIVPDAAAAEAV